MTSPAIDFRHGRWQQVLPTVSEPVDLAICDPIYGDPDRSWIPVVADLLRPGGAIFVFEDASGAAQAKLALDEAGLQFRNWLIWPNEWGGRPRDRFAQKHDDIFYYTKPGAHHTFNGQAVAVPKVTLSASMNPSGRTTKIPGSVWTDLAGFSTTAKERVRINGKGAEWQKPERLIERLVLAASDPGQLVLDPFGGVATVPAVCARLGRRCISCEADKTRWQAGRDRLAA